MCHPDTYCEKEILKKSRNYACSGTRTHEPEGPGLKSGAFDHSAIHASIPPFTELLFELKEIKLKIKNSIFLAIPERKKS